MKLVIVINVVLTLLSMQTMCSTGKQVTSSDMEGKKQVYKRNVAGSWFQDRLAAQLVNSSEWVQFTPNLPTPDEVDCEVEIKLSRWAAGRCVRLGGLNQVAVCQSGEHLDFRTQCPEILSARERGVNGHPLNAWPNFQNVLLQQQQLQQQQQQQQQPQQQHVVRKRSVRDKDDRVSSYNIPDN